MRAAGCHRDRKHYARGLCEKCYENSGRRFTNSKKARCHPELAHAARGLCRQCYQREYHFAYQCPPASLKKNRETSWLRKLGFKFTVAEYDALLAAQNGGCAICGKKPNGRHLAVDHDHAVSAARGLLCDYCNRRLIVPRNTPESLERAAKYLRGELTF